MEDIPHPSDIEQPGDTEVSPGEKEMLAMLVQPSARMKFSLRKVEIRPGAVDWIYEIPDELKYETIKKCWPFAKPKLGKHDKNWFDLHSAKVTKSERLNIIRWRGRNLVVSEFYEETGGMAVDLLGGKSMPKKGQVIAVGESAMLSKSNALAITGVFGVETDMEDNDNG